MSNKSSRYDSNFWYRVQVEAFTAIRYGFTINQLDKFSREYGDDTPVSGDRIAELRAAGVNY